MNNISFPVALLKIGHSVPVDLWDADGALLLARSQPVLTKDQLESLSAGLACITPDDAQAWQISYEHLFHQLLAQGADVDTLASVRLPREIGAANDTAQGEAPAGWLDLQESLRGLLYQGEAAINPLGQLDAIESRALDLLRSNVDESLFMLFQALDDGALGYCATHALLSAVVCELTAEKLGVADSARRVLFRSAMVMNIGMAPLQDRLATQSSAPVEAQRKLIRDHPQTSLETLQQIGVIDKDQLDIVRWHHEFDESCGLIRNVESRRILHMADCFVAKMAPRKTRLAMSPLGAVKSIFMGAAVDTSALGSVMTTTVGFYPPGTYVQLVSGEKAVCVARGQSANHPHVVSIFNPGGMPLQEYLFRDTGDPHFAIRSPLNAEKIKGKVSLEKMRQARQNAPS